MTTEPVLDLPTLETARLCLRGLRLEDATDQQAFAAEPDVAGPGMWALLPTLAENRQDLIDTLERQARGDSAEWGVELRSEARLIGRCGFVGFRPAHGSAELGFALSKPYWRQGYMSEAVVAALGHGFGTLGLHRIEAICLAENAASRGLLEKAGFEFEGTARQAYLQAGVRKDLSRYAVLRRDWVPATGRTKPAGAGCA
jgi:[ribosomal protein S5]-alanine N-acetyltransferase